ncbi:DUF6600 domain-containing protein [Pontibacter silvestris]|uniref:DUF6600 domain-containing protein n=1 Tax=Pontibacter silvestris TaxID=2305183 RepID=A0ABW4X4I6_9BACT|nr:DUF6600 domain-containing protein [Pontibacter silvestris]MCC9135079.1 hypothetical protein [Pontibacter silvestris]
METIKKIWISCLIALLAISIVLPEKAKAQVGVSISYQTFYDELSPYGRWINYPNQGYVWIPDAGPDFQPYATNGHWVVTEYGNTWVSDYDWGWAPFHYGRWLYDDLYGWVWVPGTEWGPAWVSWRSGGGYYGWAPLGPGVNISVNINIPIRHWVFVPQMYITSPRVYTYCVPGTRVINVYRKSNFIRNEYRHNNHVYAYGPRRDEIERVTRSRVQVHRVDNMDRPGRYDVRGGAVRVYRPDVADNRHNTGRPERIASANTAGNRIGTSSENRSRPDSRTTATYSRDRAIRSNTSVRKSEGLSRTENVTINRSANPTTQRQEYQRAEKTEFGRTSRGEAIRSRSTQQPTYERSQQQRSQLNRESVPNQQRTQREVQTQRSQTKQREASTVRSQRSQQRSERQQTQQRNSSRTERSSSHERD